MAVRRIFKVTRVKDQEMNGEIVWLVWPSMNWLCLQRHFEQSSSTVQERDTPFIDDSTSIFNWICEEFQYFIEELHTESVKTPQKLPLWPQSIINPKAWSWGIYPSKLNLSLGFFPCFFVLQLHQPSKYQGVFIFLHGFGDSARGFVSQLPNLLQLPSVRYVLPTAPSLGGGAKVDWWRPIR